MKGPNTSFWSIRKNGAVIGKVTSAVYSPRLNKNIALAMVGKEHAILGSEVNVLNRSGIVNEAGTSRAVIVERPFYDPNKKIAAA